MGAKEEMIDAHNNMCGNIQENNTEIPYRCQKDVGHNGNHTFSWKEKGKVHINGIEQDGEIELMTWW